MSAIYREDRSLGNRTRKLSDADVSDIKRRYEAGQTGPEIAAAYGVHVSAIYYRLHQRVIVRNSSASRSKGKAALEQRLADAEERIAKARAACATLGPLAVGVLGALDGDQAQGDMYARSADS